MSLTTRRPLRFAGANVNSGYVNTGEIRSTRGGEYTGTVWSGGLVPATRGCLHAPQLASGNQVLAVSGPGRLHTIMPLVQMVSGVTVYAYDNNLPARSGAGPVANLLSESGARVLGIIPTTFLGGDVLGTVLSGGNLQGWQGQIVVDAPFHSGLFFAAASGAPGFSFTYSLETNQVDQDTA